MARDYGERKWLSGARLALVALLVTVAIEAAAQGGTGVISGTIRDAQGAVLPGVTVTLRNQATGVSRTTVSESDGTYRFPALNPGRFTVATELAGFATTEARDLEITIGLGLIQGNRVLVGWVVIGIALVTSLAAFAAKDPDTEVVPGGDAPR